MNFEEWKEKRLGEVAKITKLSGFEFTKCFNYVDDGDIIAIRALNVKNGTLDLTDVKRITSSTSCGLTRSKLYKNDIVLTYTGAKFGEVAIIKYNNKFHLAPNVAKATPLENICYPYYLYCFMRSDNFHTQLINYSVGSSQPTIPMNIIRQLSVLLPPLSEQKTIAATLSCLDDKIELNNRMNRTLEEMAQAIFKSWFVDFEQFQNGEFVDSELGPIPKGWRVGTLGECIELFDSQRVPLSSRQREKMKKIYPYYGATSIMDYVDNYLFDGMYVLLGEDGSVVDDNGYPILQYVWGKFWVNNHAHILKGKSGFNEDSLYMLLRNTNVRGAVTGAVQLKINQANLKALKVLIPSAVDLEKYNSLLEPIFAFRRSCSEETQKLILTRDSLLPKLMSGEIRVPLEVK